MLSVIPQGLTQEEAKFRVKQIKEVEYHLTFQFRKNRLFFEGEVLIQFQQAGSLENLFLDATDLILQHVEIDQHPVPLEDPQLHNRRLALPHEYFSSLTSRHQLRIRYQGRFHSNQVGLFRFHDQETQEDYFFTHLEPYGANKVFPCFDQPDIPGRFTVALKFPCGWEAVTNTYFQIEPETESESEQFWRSQQSLPFSTYLFALAVGPLKVVQNEQYPHIRLYLRPNRIENPQNYFDPTFLFETAAHNLAFFERQFDTPHPYQKLDLVGVPTYINGGMENVGAIFLSETQMVTSEPPSQFQKYNQFLLISHEISHLWFGDLVTMAWWNDLWLKESFATLMSYEAAAQIAYFRDEVWVYFHERAKRDLFRLDSHSRIKPVIREVPDAETADWSFDGICYRKGAALLKQLQLYVGTETFWKGIQTFFKRYAFQAVTFQDWLTCFENESEHLPEYMFSWVQRSGYPKIFIHSSASQVQLKQEDSLQQKRVWTIPLELQMIEKNGKVLSQKIQFQKQQQSFPIASSFPSAPEIAYFYPNGRDFSFVRPILKRESLETAFRCPRPSDSIQRVLLLSALWDGVQFQEISFSQFVDRSTSFLEQEKIALIYNSGIDKLLYGAHRYLTETQQIQLKSRFKCWVQQQLDQRTMPQDSLLSLLDLLIFCIETPEDANCFFELYPSKNIFLSRKQKYTIAMEEVHKGWKSPKEIISASWFSHDPEFAQDHTLYLETISNPNKMDLLHKVIDRSLPVGMMSGYLEALFFSASEDEKVILLEQILPAFPILADSMRFWSFTPLVAKAVSKQTSPDAVSILQQFLSQSSLSAPLQDLIQGSLEDLEEDFRIRSAQTNA